MYYKKSVYVLVIIKKYWIEINLTFLELQNFVFVHKNLCTL